MTNFLPIVDLVGAHGALPLYYSEQLSQQLREKNTALVDFYTLFQRRLCQLYLEARQPCNLAYWIQLDKPFLSLEKALAIQTGWSIRVIPFSPFWYRAPVEEQSRIGRGGQYHRLGKNWILGKRVRVDYAHFRMEIYFQDFKSYSQFVTQPIEKEKLQILTRLYVGHAYHHSIKAILPLAQREKMHLGKAGILLGKNSFL